MVSSEVEVRDGIVGSFSIEPSGDPSVGPITVSVAGETFETADEIGPQPALVDAACGG